MKWFIYGEVTFTTSAKRNAAGRRFDNRAAGAGFTPEAWQELVNMYGDWPAGRADIVKDGLPGLRFCYSTTDQATATAAVEDVTAAWDVFQDSNSWWAYAAVP